jgi:hypothetical protein
MANNKYTFNKFITETVPTFLLGGITTLLLLGLLYGCTEPPKPTFIKKVTVVKVDQWRAPNTLQEYEVKWKVILSDGNTATLSTRPKVGDTITYRYYSIKK